MGSRAKRNFSARLPPESNVEKKRLEFVGKWSARRDEPLDPQEGRGLVFFAVVAGAQVLDGGVRGIRGGLQPGAGGARVAEGHLEAVLEPDEAGSGPGIGANRRTAGARVRGTRDGAAGEDGNVAQVRHG